jgi:hypothetical protein
MENGCIFYGHLVYFLTSCYILWSFGIICGNFMYFELIFKITYVAFWYIFGYLVYFNTLWSLSQKIWEPCFVRETNI